MIGSGHYRGPFRDINSLFLFLLLGYSLYLAFLLVEPFLNTLIISAVVCAVGYPIFSWIHLRVRRRSLAALCATMIIGVLLIIPLFFLTWGLAVQGAHSLAVLQSWMMQFKMEDVLGQGYMQTLLDWVGRNLPFVKVDEINIQAKLVVYSEEFAQYLVGFSKDLLRNAADLLLKFALMMFMVFFFLRDGHLMISRLKDLAPLKKKHEDVLIESMQRVSRVVFAGSILVAILQGIVGGIGFSIVGIPGLFWGTMMAFAALIPVVGSSLIWWPAVVWLALSDQWGWAIFLVCWSIGLVVNIDTFLRPWILGGASKISPFYIFLSILGGVAAFGFKGILYGPLMLSFAMIMLDIYAEEYRDELTQADSSVPCVDPDGPVPWDMMDD